MSTTGTTFTFIQKLYSKAKDAMAPLLSTKPTSWWAWHPDFRVCPIGGVSNGGQNSPSGRWCIASAFGTSQHSEVGKNNAVTRLTMLTDWKPAHPVQCPALGCHLKDRKPYLVSVRELNSIASNSQDLTRTSCSRFRVQTPASSSILAGAADDTMPNLKYGIQRRSDRYLKFRSAL